jgi:hypothetical protein
MPGHEARMKRSFSDRSRTATGGADWPEYRLRPGLPALISVQAAASGSGLWPIGTIRLAPPLDTAFAANARQELGAVRRLPPSWHGFAIADGIAQATR